MSVVGDLDHDLSDIFVLDDLDHDLPDLSVLNDLDRDRNLIYLS